MTPPKGWKRSFHFDRYGRRMDESLDEELRFHFEERIERLKEQGLSEEEAMSEARRLLGDIDEVRDECTGIDSGSGGRTRNRRSIGDRLSDLRYAGRALRSEPLFTAVAVLILALGIGTTTAMFSIISAVLLRPLPYAEPDRLVMFQKIQRGNLSLTVSGHDFYDFDEQCLSWSSLAMIAPWTDYARVEIDGESERVSTLSVTWNLFSTLGLEPVAGRFFTAEEANPENFQVAVLSHRYWQNRFGGSHDVIGKAFSTTSGIFTIIGVLPPGYRFLAESDTYTMLFPGHPYTDNRMYHNFVAVGRLAPEVTIEQAQEELDLISASLAEEYPDTNADKGVVLIGLQEFLVSTIRTSLLLLMGTVALVLLIACGNVAGLLLARGQARQAELAVRTALGATRRTLVAQFLSESLFISLLAGIVGVVIALFSGQLLMQLLPLDQLGIIPRALDPGILMFALGLSLLTGLIFGTIPALRVTDIDPARHLQSGSRTTTSRRSSRLRSALVSAQVAMAVVLLIGSGLLIRSLQRQLTVDLGFANEKLLTAELDLPTADYPPEALPAVYDELRDRITSLPGVTSTALVSHVPILHPWGDPPAYPSHEPPASNADATTALFRVATPEYFATMGRPIVMGRTFSASDAANTRPVTVINERLARQWYADMNPLGRSLTVMMDTGPVEYEIIGVVADARIQRASSTPYQTNYVSYYQSPRNITNLVVRTTGDPVEVVPAIRDIIRNINHRILFTGQQTMQAIVNDSLGSFRVVTTSMSLLAGLALLLTAIGLYGMLAYNVNIRRRELGVRMAMGANRSNVITLIVRRGLLLVGIGLVPGIIGAVFGSSLLEQLLFETEPLQLTTYAGACLFMLGVVLIACLIPAWRASSINPVTVLQAE